MLTKDQVLHIAKLAKIKLQDSEIESFQNNLSSIVDFTGKLNEVDTDGIEPTSQVTGMTNEMREDTVLNCSSLDELLQCTPHEVENHQIKIPKIM